MLSDATSVSSIVGILVTATGSGGAAVSGTGQVYAYGTVQHRGNPNGFSSGMAAISVAGDGSGYAAVSGAGQVYTYGTVQHRGNGDPGGYRLILDRSTLPRDEYDDPHHDYPAIDLPTPTGTRAYAVTSGVVVHVGGSCGYGIGINGDDGAYYQYCHFRDAQRLVAAGARVVPGQLIGYTGASGNVSGPHLHFEVRWQGQNRCPQGMLLALYDGIPVPLPNGLAATGCTN